MQEDTQFSGLLQLYTRRRRSRGLCIAGGNIEIDRERNPLRVDINSKGEKAMRIAVTYENGNVFGHFGRTEQFKVMSMAKDIPADMESATDKEMISN